MDFSKAFDIVPHDCLLHTLHFYGIHDRVNRSINNFHSGRSQKVIIDGAESQEALATSAVPHGSVLGPILFLAFINEQPECVSSDCILFVVDDSIIYRPISSSSDCQDLQSNLNRLTVWEERCG